LIAFNIERFHRIFICECLQLVK